MRVAVTVRSPRGATDLLLRCDPDTPVGRLLPVLRQTAGLVEGERLTVDGEPLDPAAAVAGSPLRDGAVLLAGVDPPAEPPPATLLRLCVDGGPDAGAVHPLPRGAAVVGRATGCELTVDDPELSRRHLRVVLGDDGVTVADLGSTNGTTVDGRPVTAAPTPLPTESSMGAGATTLSVRGPAEPAATLAARSDGARGFNRPPRVRCDQEPATVRLPEAPSRPAAARVPLLGALAPAGLGLVLALTLGEWRWLLFLLLSPVAVGGQAVADRVRARRARRTAQVRFAAALDRARERVAAAVAAEERARRAADPGPAELLDRAAGPGPRLWERRRGDPDFLRLRVGLGDLPAAVQVVDPTGRGPDPVARRVPITVSLPRAGVVGVCGRPARVAALARWLVAQAVTLHSPRDLQVVLLTAAGHEEGWRWARWLPHLRPGPGHDCHALIGAGPEQAAARVAELRALVTARRAAGHHGAPPAAAVLLVVDGARRLRRVPGLAALLADGPSVGVHALCLDTHRQDLAEECGTVVTVAGDVGTELTVHEAAAAAVAGVPDGVRESWAERVARALAPLRDDSPQPSDALPERARWAELAGLHLTGADGDAAGLLARWAAGPSTRVLLGAGGDGPVTVDLRDDGPHLLVAGTTGSGKSELLRTLVASLAAGNPPEAVTFVLVDYKGGAAFGPSADLPHVTGLVTDLDAALTARALTSLGAELRRREEALAAAGVASLDDPGAPALARLVIVVDEFATLAEELPEFVDGLVGVAQRGRSLGVHLVLATQRPGGVVGPDIRANANLRICLAVTRDTDSLDVLGCADAARISRRLPGRALVRTGHGELTAVQTALVATAGSALAAPPSAELLAWERLGEPAGPQPDAPAGDVPSDLELLVRAARAAAASRDVPGAPPPWLPPLPGVVTVTDLPVDPASPAGMLPFAWQDLPGAQARRVLALDLARGGSLLVAGGPRSGRSTLLRTLAGVAAERLGPADVHLYGIDAAGGELAGLAALPHCGAVVDPTDPDRLGRLLRMLHQEMARRRRVRTSPDDGHRAPPHLLLLVDGWDRLTEEEGEPGGGRQLDGLLRLAADGPSVGLHVVVTGGRRALIGPLRSAVTDTLVLPLADAGDYGLVGLPARAVPTVTTPGRGLWLDGTVETQVAVLTVDPSPAAQRAALSEVAARAAGWPAALGRRPVPVDPLPRQLPLRQLGAATGPAAPGVPLGVGGDVLGAVSVDLTELGGSLVVAGPPGSGRSTTLLTLAAGLRGPTVVVAPRRSPLRRLPGATVCTDPADRVALESALRRDGPPPVVLVDDAELLAGGPLDDPLVQVVRRARDGLGALVVAGSTDELAVGFRGFVVEARRARAGLVLAPGGAADGELFGVRLPRLPGDPPPGRGVLAVRGRCTVVQVAVPECAEPGSGHTGVEHPFDHRRESA